MRPSRRRLPWRSGLDCVSPYLTMSKADYLALVDHLAARAGVAMSAELLHAQAMTWEIRHAGRTPRTAQQFIASLSLQEKQ